MFTEEMTKRLSAPLDPKHVAKRDQAGQSLSYVEGWHVIAEANRIFGFDGWTRETIEFRCVSERERKIGRQQKEGFGVTYIAKVRVTVNGVVRDGCGSGHGISTDLGECHESALKEAETDAMKRAFMTFGNPFGLALYDKTRANVSGPPIELITDDQRAEITAMAQGAGVELAAICKSASVDSLKQIPAVKFEKIINRLKATMQANAEKQKVDA